MKCMTFMDPMVTPPGNFAPHIRLGQIFLCQTQTFGLTVVPHQVPLVFKIFFHSANISGQEKTATAQGQPEPVGPIAFHLIGNIGAQNNLRPPTNQRITTRRYGFQRRFTKTMLQEYCIYLQCYSL